MTTSLAPGFVLSLNINPNAELVVAVGRVFNCKVAMKSPVATW
jgi:hypothetical protein